MDANTYMVIVALLWGGVVGRIAACLLSTGSDPIPYGRQGQFVGKAQRFIGRQVLQLFL